MRFRLFSNKDNTSAVVTIDLRAKRTCRPR